MLFHDMNSSRSSGKVRSFSSIKRTGEIIQGNKCAEFVSVAEILALSKTKKALQQLSYKALESLGSGERI